MIPGNSICGVGDQTAGEGLFDSSAMTLLAETLKFNTSIARVILGNNRLQVSVEAEEAPAVQVLSDVIKHNASLTHLDLNNSLIGPSGAKALAQGAMLSATLKTLEISGGNACALAYLCMRLQYRHYLANVGFHLKRWSIPDLLGTTWLRRGMKRGVLAWLGC